MSDDDLLRRRAESARTALQTESRRHLVPAPGTAGRSRRRFPAPGAGRRTQVLGSLVALAALVVAVSFLVGGLWHRPSVVAPGVTTSVPAGQRPVAVVTDGSRIYVADAGSGSVTAFERDRLSTVWSVSLGTRAVALALGRDGGLWVVDAGTTSLVELDATDGHELQRGRTSADPVGVAVTDDAVWVLAPGNGTLDKYDPTTATQVGSAIVDRSATGVVYGAGYLWVTAPDRVQRVLTTATRQPGSVLDVPLTGGPVGVAAVGRTAWVALSSGSLVRLDPEDPAAAGAPRTALDAPPTALTVLADGSAVVSTTAGTLTRVPISGSPSRSAGPGAPLDSLSWSSSLLVGVSPASAQLYATEVSP